MKKNEGITLIALIITIIILIILTAVTINNVIGTDLIGFATKAVENYTDAARDEADKVDKLVRTLENQGVGEESKVRAGEIVEKTEKDNYTDADGRKATIPEGFKVSTKSSEQYIKDGLVIQDEQENEFVWVPCYYETQPENALDDLQEYKKHNYSGTDGNVWKTFDYTQYNDWTDDASKDASSYGNDSVKKYGGFYIARYEAGWDETTVEKLNEEESKTDYITPGWEQEKTKKNISTGKTPISKANVFSWNFINQENAKTVSENMYKKSETEGHANSYLVDGTAWDTITNWIATDVENIVTDSTLYGNYYNNNSDYTGWYAEHVWGEQKPNQVGGATGWLYAKHFTNGSIKLHWVRLSDNDLWEKKKDNYTDSNNADINKNYLDTRIEIPTGSFDKFKLKNIYDLAGNMWEWTTEVGNHSTDNTTTNGSLLAVFRGGEFRKGGVDFPLCFRYGNRSSSAYVNVDIRVPCRALYKINI